ncbi:hypothetical protein [Pseudooceanicola sp. HF7]|uniref:hypothetical protein n=1 Tax=Pseudooceanicola sp. HF7 TaxID=2721560 RepID=UPI001C375E6E|nr:hypothetical protein [Pseudooceanicola sp. HF7]
MPLLARHRPSHSLGLPKPSRIGRSRRAGAAGLAVLALTALTACAGLPERMPTYSARTFIDNDSYTDYLRRLDATCSGAEARGASAAAVAECWEVYGKYRIDGVEQGLDPDWKAALNPAERGRYARCNRNFMIHLIPEKWQPEPDCLPGGPDAISG